MSSHPAIESGSVDVMGHRIGYLDSGEGEQTLLLVHGNLVSSHVFARLIDRLPARYRCVAPDLLGFGRSDKPADEADYTLQKHVGLVAEFVRALGLQDVVLVVHDWGGPIGVGAALAEKERYTHLVVLNTVAELPMRIPLRYWLQFHVLLGTKRVADYLIKERNLFQRIAVSDMDESDQAVYFRANDEPATRAGIAAFPRMVPTSREHPDYPRLRSILTDLETWDVPALVLFSDRDTFFSAERGEQLADRMRDARFELVSGAGHFLQYEHPGDVATAIDAFLREER